MLLCKPVEPCATLYVFQGQDFSNQDLQRSNFTAADARDASFKNSKLQVRVWVG
jgi:uncharacterized protein YjbI with pentapeptide repeats